MAELDNWGLAMMSMAEHPCSCTLGADMCRSCWSRLYVMEQLYGETETDRLIREAKKDDPTYVSYISGDHVMLSDGVYVPIDQLEAMLDDDEEIDAIIEQYHRSVQ